MNLFKISVSICFLFITAYSAEKAGPAIPAHPAQLRFESLNWSIPLGEPYRAVLNNGLRSYVATDSSLPLVQISGFIKYGSLLDPIGKEGLASALATMIRYGGTEKYPADTLDKLIDQLAMRFNFSSNESSLNFNISFLSEYTDTAFSILEQMLFHPVFDQKKFDKRKSIYIEAIRHRFDNPGPTLDAAYQKIMYPNTIASIFSSEQSIKAITRDDLLKMHKKYIKTGNIIFSIAGPFDRSSMISRLEKSFPSNSIPSDTLFPVIDCKPELRSLLVFKPISQAYVRLGLPLFKRPNPDYYPVSVLNMILGGGGFTSRLTTKIRSDEGLTYSIYSSVESNYAYPGTFFVEFYTKNQSFPRATYLVFEEINKIVKDGVTDDELKSAKETLIGELPSMFRSPFDIVSTYAWNEFYGRSPEHYTKYIDEIKKINRDDIIRVAKKYLTTDKMTMTVVGDTTALLDSKDTRIDLRNFSPQKSIDASFIPQLP